jgi:hypothetical protein
VGDLIGWRWAQALEAGPDEVWHAYRKSWTEYTGFNVRTLKVPKIQPRSCCQLRAARTPHRRTLDKPLGKMCPQCRERVTRSIVEDT